MAVTATAGDADGAAIDARITALAAHVASGITGSALAQSTHLLDQTRREAVYHYLGKGRISAATILSTLS